MNQISFQEIPQKFNDELFSCIEKIQNECLRNFYKSLQYKYFDLRTCQDENDLKLLLSDALKDFKFITYDICKHNEENNVSLFNICVEDYLIIIESTSTSLIDEILKNNNYTMNVNEPKNENGDINEFYSKFYKDIKPNKMIKSIFRSVSSYLINRYFYPTHYFKNSSFFNYKNEKSNYSTRIKEKITQILQSDDRNNINRLTSELKNEINSKFEREENEEKLPIYDFKKDDFVKLHELAFNTNYSFVIEKNTLYIFLMKEVNSNAREVQFYEKLNHSNFARSYGFIKDKHQNVTHIIYEYMSNGNLLDFMKNKENQIDEAYSLLTTYRIFKGIEYLKTNSRIHRDLKPANILINHDFIPFISDVELVKELTDDDGENFTSIVGYDFYQSPEIMSNENISYKSDIFSFGLLVYYLFEKENMVVSSEFLNLLKELKYKNKTKMKNGRENIQQIYSSSVVHNQDERISHDEIKEKLLNEYKSYYYLDKYFIKEYEKGLLSIISQFIYEIIEILNQNELKIFINHIQEFFLTKLNIDKIDKKQSILIIIGDNYYYKHYYSKAFEFYNLSAQLDNSNGHLYLADLYYFGRGCQMNYSKALEHYEKSANLGNAKSLFNLGNMYLSSDIQKALKYYESAAELNLAVAYTAIAKVYYEGTNGIEQDYVKAKYYSKKSAKQDEPGALMLLGSLYLDGKGTKVKYDKAKKYLDRSVELGNVGALIELGRIYLYGFGVKTDYEKAKDYFEKAKYLNVKAYHNLGYMYYNGLGVQHDFNKAIECYKKSAIEEGESCFELGEIYLYGNGAKPDFVTAKQYFEKAAKKNYPLAYLTLGIMYQYGYGVPKINCRIAFQNYEIAASFNVPKGLINLGFFYYIGIETKQDYKKAKELYELAAKQNDPQAFYNLGILYFLGQGVEKDYKESLKYFQLAEKQGDVPSLIWIGNFYYCGFIVEINCTKAFEYYTKSVESGFIDGYLNLGICHFYGNGVKQDYSKAIECFKSSLKSPRHIVQLSHIFLGYSYLEGYGVIKDIGKTIEHFESSAKYGHTLAYLGLGIVYLNGYGYEINHKKSKLYFEFAAQQNNSTALHALGSIYFTGRGVEKDYLKAIEYFKKSALQNNSKSFLMLGIVNLYGIGVEQDLKKAKEYFNKIEHLEIFNPSIYFNLGCYYDIYEANFSEALKYYKLTEKYNNSFVLCNLGNLYYYGNGVPKEYEKALFYYEKAAKQNNYNAYLMIGKLYLNGYGVEQDYKKALEFFEKAANADNSDALLYIGSLYYYGKGVEKNYEKSKKYFEQSASFGNSHALLYLSYFYYNGRGVKKNYMMCKRYLELSAQLNNYAALYELGELHSNNNKFDIDIEKAIQYFTKCCNKFKPQNVQVKNCTNHIVIYFLVNNYRYPACNSLGLIYLLNKNDFDNAFNYIKESGHNEFPFGQNVLGLIYEIKFNDIEKAAYFYVKSANYNFSLAYFNLANLKENENKIEESIDYYIKASENEDEKLIFRNINLNDVRLDVSKTFIICYTNLKLCLYFFTQSKFDK